MKTNLFTLLLTAIFIQILSGFSLAQEKTQQKPLLKGDADMLYKTLETSDTAQMVDYLRQIFMQHGASVRTEGQALAALDLNLQEFTHPVNSYSNGSTTLNISEMPKQEQAETYWKNWSDILTKGAFDHQKFFRDRDEMFLLANYNVLVLTAHEYGHYFDYRYGVSSRTYESGFLTTKTPMNCVETFADLFAVAMIDHLAQDLRFAGLRARYRDLMAEFNRNIPAENRLTIAGYDAVEQECACLKLESDGTSGSGELANEQFFRRYASAYFNRHQLMLDNPKFPALFELIENRLLRPLYQKLQFTDDLISSSTLGTFELTGEDEPKNNIFSEFWIGLSDFRDEDLPDRYVRLLDGAGNVRFFKISGDASLNLRVEIQNEKMRKLDETKFAFGNKIKDKFHIARVLSVSDSEFYLLLAPKAVEKTKRNDIYVIGLRRDRKSWKPEVFKFAGLPQTESYYQYINNFLVSPDGKIHLVSAKLENDKAKISAAEISKRDFSIGPASLIGEFDPQLAETGEMDLFIGNDRRLFAATGDRLMELCRDGKLRTLAGTVDGFRDGNDKTKIELGVVDTAQFINADTIRLLDRKNYVSRPQKFEFLVREIKLR